MKLNEYINEYKILHKIKPNYGKSSEKIYNIVLSFITKNNIKTVIDYGCGKSRLLEIINNEVNIDYYKYDPAIEKYNQKPSKKYDLLICTDVLQHIPEEFLESSLEEIFKYASIFFIKIKCSSHSTLLPNGTPANCTIHKKNWWIKKFKKSFNNITEIDCVDKDSTILIMGGKYEL